VLAAVEDLGYRPSGIARSLKRRATGTFGLLVTDITNPFFPELVRAVEDAARELGYAVILGNADEDPEREAAYLELLAERRVDGMIVASSGLTDRHGRWLASAPLPVVLVNCALPDGSRPAVLTDNRAGARMAGEHLLALGHRRLGHISGQPANAAMAERLDGVRDAIGGAGMAAEALVVMEGDDHVTGGERAAHDLLGACPIITGIVCYNDLTAIGALRAIRARGLRVPADVSVVGFDDIDLAAYVDPPLTTIAQQTARIGRHAIEWLVEILAGRDAGEDQSGEPFSPRTVRLPATLRVRESTAPPAKPA